MASLTAENISLTFPLYSKADPSAPDPLSVPDERIRRDSKGKVLGVRALEDIDFHLEKGDRLALLGRNGSGKTTLLQVLAGILVPDTGRVIRQGRTTNLINISLGLQAEATGHRNITLRGIASGRSRKEIEAKRQQIADFSELGEFLDMPLLTYSAGMKMRLSFAIATAFEPEILLLDEWISTGDTSFRAKALSRMQDFVDTAGILVITSHNIKLLRENCNRAIWLNGGKIFMSGGVKEVTKAYREWALGQREKKEPDSDVA